MKSLGKVLDISSFQGMLTQDAVTKIKARGILGVILRIGFTGYGQGVPTYDKCFQHNYKLLHDAGIPCGAYYFTLAYNDTITLREINWLRTELPKYKFEFPVYIDVEKLNLSKKDETPISVAWDNCRADVRTKNVAKICETLEALKYYVGVYASTGAFGSLLLEAPLKSYDKWIAQYYLTCTYKGTYHLWQYTSKGNGALYGLPGRVDMSECYLDFPSVIKKNHLNGYGVKKDVYKYQLTLSDVEKNDLDKYLSANSIEYNAEKL